MSDDEIMIGEVELDTVVLMLQSGEASNKRSTGSRPTAYRGGSDRTKCRENNEMHLASQLTGQSLFDVWGLENP